ncbi:MAG: DUF4179 domain-containing protein [Clostridiales bacterium]|nr:DUF4179 domain-containing protein [Clostridiales bacterium]
MKVSMLKQAYSPVPPAFHEELMRAAQSVKEECTMMKRTTVVLIAVFLLAVLCGTAFALFNYYSVRQYETGGKPSAVFEEHIVELNQTYQNDYITLTLGDAVFDGSEVAMTMNLSSQESSKPVYLYPRLSAYCGERKLDIDVQGSRGDFYSGFLFPNIADPDVLGGQYGFDAIIYEDVADTDVRWVFTMKVLWPNWPLVNDTVILHGDDNDPPFEVYMQTFRDAYDNRKILLTYGESVVEYASRLPIPEGMTPEEAAFVDLPESLVNSGAFTLVDTIECVFTTPLPITHHSGLGKGITFPVPGGTIAFGGLDFSFLSGRYQFELIARDEKALASFTGHEAYEMTLPNGDVIPCSSRGVAMPGEHGGDSRALMFSGEFQMPEEVPDVLTFVFYSCEWPGDGSEVRTYDPARNFTLPLGELLAGENR